MTDDTSARMVEAEQAEQAIRRFLKPALDTLKAEYLIKLADVAAKPMTANLRAGMEKLAIAIKVVDQVSGQLNALILDGNIARQDAERASRIADMTTEQARWASY